MQNERKVLESARAVFLAHQTDVCDDLLAGLRAKAAFDPVVLDFTALQHLPLDHVQLKIFELAQRGVGFLLEFVFAVPEDLADPLIRPKPAAIARQMRDSDQRVFERRAVP